MPFSSADLPTIIGLLEQMATRRETEDVLRRIDVPFSAASWDQFVEKRIRPALEGGKLSIDALADLLREADEHGRQHILLFRLPKAVAIGCLDEGHVRRGLRGMGSPAIYDSPLVLDQPGSPTWVEARIERTPNGQPKALVLKRVRTEEHRERLGETREGNTVSVTFKVEDFRAVDLVKLHADGFCEVRLQCHRKPDYHRECSQLLMAVRSIIPAHRLATYTIAVAKDSLFKNRKQLKDEIRFTTSDLRNDNGNVLRAAAGQESGDLFEDEGMTSSLGAFIDHDGYCDASNVWMRFGHKDGDKKQPNWVHVLLAGGINEFALPAQVSVREYDHVIETLRRHNR